MLNSVGPNLEPWITPVSIMKGSVRFHAASGFTLPAKSE